MIYSPQLDKLDSIYDICPQFSMPFNANKYKWHNLPTFKKSKRINLINYKQNQKRNYIKAFLFDYEMQIEEKINILFRVLSKIMNEKKKESRFRKMKCLFSLQSVSFLSNLISFN